MSFSVVIARGVSFQQASELLNFELCGQSYDQFTQDYAEHIEARN